MTPGRGLNHSHWRATSTPLIVRALVATRGQEERAIKAALRAIYPFGERENHPYKIWCSEVKRLRAMPAYVLDLVHADIERRAALESKATP